MTALVFDRYPAGGGEFALALALADNAHDDGTHIFPSVATMAHKSRQSERSVQRCLGRMVASTWLLVVKNGKGGAGRFVEYRINPAWIKGDNLTPFFEAVDNPEKGDNGDKKGCQTEQKRVTTEAKKGDTGGSPYITTRTSIEPPLPPKGGVSELDNQKPEHGDSGFAEFWQAFPKKLDPLKARKAWDKIAPTSELRAKIIAAVQVWRARPEWLKDDGRWIPKPANWLRGGRWMDEPGLALELPPPVAKVVEPERPAAPMPECVRELHRRLVRKKVQATAQGAG